MSTLLRSYFMVSTLDQLYSLATGTQPKRSCHKYKNNSVGSDDGLTHPGSKVDLLFGFILPEPGQFDPDHKDLGVISGVSSGWSSSKPTLVYILYESSSTLAQTS